MSALRHVLNYAIKFEQAYAANDWKIVEECFTPDASYVMSGAESFAGTHEGRDAVLGYFAGSTAAFDKRFDSREVILIDGPEDRNGTVWFRWEGIYKLAGAPDLHMEGETTATVRGTQIARLEDWIPPESAVSIAAYMQAHGAKLRG